MRVLMPVIPSPEPSRTPRPPAELSMLIDGLRRRAETTYPVIDPYRGETVAHAPQSTLRDLDHALDAAVAAKTVAAATPGYERAALLRRVSALLAQRAPEFAEIMTRETGK